MHTHISRTYTGRQVATATQRLIEASCWFAVTPLPDAHWEVSVKAEAEPLLPEFAPVRVEPVLSVKDLQDLGYTFHNDELPPFCHYWQNDQERSKDSFITLEIAQDDAIEDALCTYDLSRCDDCGKVHNDSSLQDVHKLSQRVGPGDIMPSGECDCGALAFPLSLPK